MINTSAACLLMIEPSASTSTEPVIDGLTQRMAAALNRAAKRHAGQLPGGPFMCTRGWHTAASGANSDNVCWQVELLGGSMVETNSLAVHYLAYSRDEIPVEELAKLELLPLDFAEPTQEQLWPGRKWWVVEMRNGGYLGADESRSWPLAQARLFASQEAAEAEAQQWMLAGGMAVSISSTHKRPADRDI